MNIKKKYSAPCKRWMTPRVHYAMSRGCTNNWRGEVVNNKNSCDLADQSTRCLRYKCSTFNIEKKFGLKLIWNCTTWRLELYFTRAQNKVYSLQVENKSCIVIILLSIFKCIKSNYIYKRILFKYMWKQST